MGLFSDAVDDGVWDEMKFLLFYTLLLPPQKVKRVP